MRAGGQAWERLHQIFLSGRFAQSRIFFRAGAAVGLSVGDDLADRFASALSWHRQFVKQIDPSFPIEFIAILRRLVKLVPDLSQGLKRHIYLANTGYEITLEDASEKDQERGQELIKQFFRDRPGLVNHLIRQTCITGALSAECAPSVGLDDVDIQVIPAELIRFRREPVEGSNSGATVDVPFQLMPRGDMRRLDTEQYTYEALERDEGNPYGIPPFISAMESVFVQRAGRSNIKAILDKLGMLGLVHVAQDRPRREPNEDDAGYRSRLLATIGELRDKIMRRVRSGIIFTYNDTKVAHTPIVGDARAHEPVWRANEEQVASGIDTDPALMGRSYSTTETYAGVVFAAFEGKLGNVRHPTERFLRDKALDQYLRLHGLSFSRLSWKWEDGVSLNAVAESRARYTNGQSDALRQRMIFERLERGIIDLDTAAQELGYDKAAGLPPQAAATEVKKKARGLAA